MKLSDQEYLSLYESDKYGYLIKILRDSIKGMPNMDYDKLNSDYEYLLFISRPDADLFREAQNAYNEILYIFSMANIYSTYPKIKENLPTLCEDVLEYDCVNRRLEVILKAFDQICESRVSQTTGIDYLAEIVGSVHSGLENYLRESNNIRFNYPEEHVIKEFEDDCKEAMLTFKPQPFDC